MIRIDFEIVVHVNIVGKAGNIYYHKIPVTKSALFGKWRLTVNSSRTHD